MIRHDFMRSLTAFNGMDSNTEEVAQEVGAVDGGGQEARVVRNEAEVLEVRIKQVTSDDHVEIVKLFQVSIKKHFIDVCSPIL